MTTKNTLDRFIKAQEYDFKKALLEIKRGRKTSHWMWYIFPQIQGLGSSEISRLYAIKDLNEANEYLNHPVLGFRLINICNELLILKEIDPYKIFGSPDDLKLHSSLTLFSLIPNTNNVFQLAIEKFFSGRKDNKTIQILNENQESSYTNI